MKYKRRARIEISLDHLGRLLGLPGKVVFATFNDATGRLVIALEGEQFPKVYEGELLQTIYPAFTIVPVRELLNMSRGELAEQNLRGAQVVQVTLDDC